MTNKSAHIRAVPNPEQKPLPELPWHVDSWMERPISQQVVYDDPDALARVLEKLRTLPPLVTSWEVERLKRHIAEAQEGKRFILQGGDCAETLVDCQPGIIAN